MAKQTVERISGTKRVAERMVRAEEDFIANLMKLGGISRTNAERVLSYYLKHKMVQMDAVNGRLDVKHGAFLDRDVIQRAASL